MLLPAYIHGKVIRLRPLCFRQKSDLLSLKTILKQHAKHTTISQDIEKCYTSQVLAVKIVFTVRITKPYAT